MFYASSRAALNEFLDGELKDGDLLITMGAGDVTAVGPEYLEHVAELKRGDR